MCKGGGSIGKEARYTYAAVDPCARRAPPRGVWGHAPQKILDFRPSEIVPGAICGRNTRPPQSLSLQVICRKPHPGASELTRWLRPNEVSILAVTSVIGGSASLAVKRRHLASAEPSPLKTKGVLEPVEPYASYAPDLSAALVSPLHFTIAVCMHLWNASLLLSYGRDLLTTSIMHA